MLDVELALEVDMTAQFLPRGVLKRNIGSELGIGLLSLIMLWRSLIGAF